MLTLGLSILSSTIILVIFKLFDRFRIDTFQAIVANYITAFACGFILYSDDWNAKNLLNTDWIYWALLCALLFISLFWVMARSSQKNGVAVTSVAVKMSMAFSLILMIALYSEPVSFEKTSGIILAIVGVLLVTIQKGKGGNSAVWMLLVLFIGSGLLDFALSYIQKHVLTTLTPSLFSAIGFGSAGILGMIILFINRVRSKIKLSSKSFIAGVVLGVPNYFSIFLLMESYRDTGWRDSVVLAVNNVGIVLLSSIFGLLLFKENLTKRKVLGLVCAILAICILALFNQ